MKNFNLTKSLGLGIFILLLVISVFFGFLTSYITGRFAAFEIILSIIPPAKTIYEETNILLLGADATPGVKRSDTIMVLHLDPNRGSTDLISIPRDTLVVIPGIGLDKINHAFAYGGPELSVRTVSSFFDVSIPYYISVNVHGLMKIIDQIGGVTVDVEKRMYYVDYSGGLYVDLKPGVQKLNGKTALGYLRFRRDGGDFVRMRRQQKFLSALGKEIINKENLIKVPLMLKELASNVRTNIETNEILNVSTYIRESYKNNRLNMYTVTGRGTLIDGIYYMRPDRISLQEIIIQVFKSGRTLRSKEAGDKNQS